MNLKHFLKNKFVRSSCLSTMSAATEKMKDILESPAGWDGLWTNKITPWDAGKSSPIIVQISNSIRGPALVPGVGAGYDCFTFGSALLNSSDSSKEVVGVDISPTAVNVANTNLASLPNLNNVSFVNDDFFHFAYLNSNKQKFKTIFDYTFLCALPPSMRLDWAKAMRNLVHEDGELITLVYPIGEYEGGPPYAMSTKLVTELLEKEGFKQKELYQVPETLSHPARAGREYIARWSL